MQAAWQIMQLDESDDFIIATGETHSLEEVVDVAFAKAGLDYKSYVKFDSRFARPGKTSVLAGDASKARKIFGFKPRVRFKEIIEAMVEYDLGQ